MSRTIHPIERAARALCSLDGHPENAPLEGKPLWQDYLPEVRAVIAAIRDPSEGMIAAVDEPAEGYGQHIWTTMIDEMLAEGR